jgi:tetratricopeptide (TPR) repeat protein
MSGEDAPGRAATLLVEGAMNLLALGDAEAAVEACDAALELAPRLAAQLWQRGLALFFAGRYSEAAAQFELDVQDNSADVEEVVFHALSVAHDARRTAAPTSDFPRLLACGADVRGPTMEAIRRLFEGSIDPEGVRETARQAGDGRPIKHKVGDYSDSAVLEDSSDGTTTTAATEAMFFAEYYIGAWFEAKGNLAAAAAHLASAAALAPGAEYMGRVAAMH